MTGTACAWPDGFAVYAVGGVKVPQYVIEQPGKITRGKIGPEYDVEVRRVMIGRYRLGEEISGAAAFIRDAGAERVDRDERYGTLWRRDDKPEWHLVSDGYRSDEPIVMLEAVNSTAEADGSFKHRWLRVPPSMQTAREAVAWILGLSGREYDPVRT